MDFGGQSEGGSFRPMCDGEALRYQSRRMTVRAKWARFASSRVVPQEMFLFLSQHILLGQVFYFQGGLSYVHTLQTMAEPRRNKFLIHPFP